MMRQSSTLCKWAVTANGKCCKPKQTKNLHGCFHQFAHVNFTFPSTALWIFYNPPHFSAPYAPGYSQSSIPCIPSSAFCGRPALHPSSSLPPQASSQSLSVWQPSLHHSSKFPSVTRPVLHTALICVLQQHTVYYTRSSPFHSSRIPCLS